MEFRELKEKIVNALYAYEQELKEEIPEEAAVSFDEALLVDKPRVKREGGFPAVCSGCGQNTTLPFEPKYKTGVYCRECYQKRRK